MLSTKLSCLGQAFIASASMASPVLSIKRDFAKRVFHKSAKKKVKKVAVAPVNDPIPEVPTAVNGIPTEYTYNKHIHAEAALYGDCTTMRQKKMEITEKGARRIKISIPPNDAHFIIPAMLRQNTGKYAAEWLRREGYIPCSISTGRNNKVMNIALDPYYAEKLRTVGSLRSSVFSLEIPGYSERFRCLVKNFLVDSVSNKTVTIQFLLTEPGRDYKVKVPVHLKGIPDCIGVKRGGIILQPTRSVNMLYKTNLAARMGVTNIPSGVAIDVVDRNVTDSVHVYDIPLPPYFHVPKNSAVQRHVLMTFTKRLG